MEENVVLIPTEECIRLLSSEEYDSKMREYLSYNAHQLLSVNGEVDENALNNLINNYSLSLQKKLDQREIKEWDSKKEEWNNPSRKPYRRVFAVERAFKKFACQCSSFRGDKREAEANIPQEQRKQLVELVYTLSRDQLHQPVDQIVKTLDVLQRMILTSLQLINNPPLASIVSPIDQCVRFANIFYNLGMNSISVGERIDKVEIYLTNFGIPEYLPEKMQLQDTQLHYNMDWIDGIERLICLNR